MDSIRKILQHIMVTSSQGISSSDAGGAHRQTEEELFNSIEGNLPWYNCHECKNKGIIYLMCDGELVCKECSCMKIRRSISRINRSGLEQAVKEKTLLNFEHESPYQDLMIQKAVDFVKKSGRCFYIGGQVGSGKTHICTGIAGALLRRGHPLRYIQWRDDIPKIKAIVNTEDYAEKLDKIKGEEILYIDDLFKTKDDAPPTAADINIAFDIINYRYNNPELVTIISSQKLFVELLEVDEAIASRIAEMSGEYCLSIARDTRRNYRLRSVLEQV